MLLNTIIIIVIFIISLSNIIYATHADQYRLDCDSTSSCAISIPALSILALSGLIIVLHIIIFIISGNNSKNIITFVPYCILILTGISLIITNSIYGPLEIITNKNTKMINWIFNYVIAVASIFGGIIGLIYFN